MKVSREDLVMMATCLQTALADQLKADYQVVNQPGPDVMRVRAAITKAKKSMVIDEVNGNSFFWHRFAVHVSYGKPHERKDPI